MMTLAVLGWQLIIILTLRLARFFGENFNKPSSIYWVSGAWIVFTLVSLFTSPLIVLQLAVIFLATKILAPSEKANKPEAVIASASFIQRDTEIGFEKQHFQKSHAPKSLEDFRKCCDSPAEEAFLDIMVQHYALKPVDDCLMGQGITLELQYPIDKCRADFLINDCLIIEIDGAAYHTSKQAIRRDTKRDKFIRSRGFHILRIPAKYPLYRTTATINKVRRAISIAAKAEVKKKYAEEDRFFHVGAEDCGLKFKSTPSGLFKATQDTLLRNS